MERWRVDQGGERGEEDRARQQQTLFSFVAISFKSEREGTEQSWDEPESETTVVPEALRASREVDMLCVDEEIVEGWGRRKSDGG